MKLDGPALFELTIHNRKQIDAKILKTLSEDFEARVEQAVMEAVSLGLSSCLVSIKDIDRLNEQTRDAFLKRVCSELDKRGIKSGLTRRSDSTGPFASFTTFLRVSWSKGASEQ
jgi:hypothetical protein